MHAPKDRGFKHTGNSSVRVEHAAGAPLVIATIVARSLLPVGSAKPLQMIGFIEFSFLSSIHSLLKSIWLFGT
jgi:hypothetical protein